MRLSSFRVDMSMTLIDALFEFTTNASPAAKALDIPGPSAATMSMTTPNQNDRIRIVEAPPIVIVRPGRADIQRHHQA
jgi:hypothetical protein